MSQSAESHKLESTDTSSPGDPVPVNERLKELPSRLQERPAMVIPFLILVAVTLTVAWLFFQLVQPFLMSLIAAAMGALACYPMHRGLRARLGGREYLSATLVTLGLTVLVLVPLALGLTIGTSELAHGFEYLRDLAEKEGPRIRDWMANLDERFQVSPEELKARVEQLGRAVFSNAVRVSGSVIGGMIGAAVQFAIFLVAFFFFLVDGERIIDGWENTTPLELEHDRKIRSEFSVICRGAIWGTIFAAILQGIVMAAGLGVIEVFVRAGLWKWLFLLGGLTSVAAVIPFVGAAAVWLPVSIILFFQDHTVAAIVVALFGFLVVSSIDNVVKILFIKDAGNLHPLLVVVCVFGGLKFMGVLGVFLGPAIGAIVFSLLRVVRRELGRLTGTEDASAPQ